MTPTTPAPIHRLIAAFADALSRLGATPKASDVEQAATIVHHAMAGRARLFHTHDHIFELIAGADPLETLAGLFHDVVYTQVDGALPPPLLGLIGGAITPAPGGFRVEPADPGDQVLRLTHRIFGLDPGVVLSGFAGVNEWLSALVAARILQPVLPRGQIAQIAACIEATIPFRATDAAGLSPLERLAVRLRVANDEFSLGLDDQIMVGGVERACRVGNRDVENFALTDPAQFLDNTWKLLPETNPTLHTPQIYTLREYRVALEKMEGFLSRLPAERVFHRFGNEPDEILHRARLDAAQHNLAVATRYLRAKLYAIGILEALAVQTGGDGPVEMFMGALPQSDRPGPRRLEQFLAPDLDPPAPDADPALFGLLAGGRKTETAFDLRASPLAARLYRSMGEMAVFAGFNQATLFWKGETAPRAFIASQPPFAVAPIARALMELLPTRKTALLALIS